MKHWGVNYSIRYKDGQQEEAYTCITGGTITEALESVKRKHTNPLKEDPSVAQVVIWDICIIEDDVFPEEGEDYDQ